jgi:hypothetical protein
MSKIALSGSASGTGTFTIASPNSNTDRTLSLPDQTGTLLTGSGAISVNASAPVPSVSVDANGNVGIGTTSPSLNTNGTILHINNSTASRAAIIHMTTAASGSLGPDGLIVGKWSDDTNYFFDYDSNPIVFGVNSAEAMRIDTSGNLLVGITSQVEGSKLSVSGSNCLGAQITAVGGGALNANYTAGSGTAYYGYWKYGGGVVGYITSTGSTVNYTSVSDYRLKEDIQPMAGALAKVAALKPCTYKWKVDGSDGQGFIAHELAEICPDAVTGEKDAVDADGNPQYQGIDTSFLVATLTAAIQELKAIVDAQGAEIAALKGTQP